MKQTLTVFILTIAIFSKSSFAQNSPFDSFSGEYEVTNHQCFDLVKNKELAVDPYSKISIIPTQENKAVRVLMKNDRGNVDLLLTEDAGIHSGRFSGDGIGSAYWVQHIKENKFLYRKEKSLFRSGNKFILTLDEIHVEERDGLPSRNDHIRCELELI